MAGLDPITDSSYPMTHTKVNWIDEAVIYQLFTGRSVFANTRDHSGSVLQKLAGVDWKRFFEKGFSAVYLLGLFDNRGPIVVMEENGQSLVDSPDRVPSIFALSSQTSVQPALGSQADLSRLIDVIHEAGGQVVVDFVPNHTGLAHPWVEQHPEYYARTSTGELVREFSGDVAKLNYEVPAVCDEMTAVLQTLAAYGVDGIRCDMAHLVPDHFWKPAITAVTAKHPHVAFIAEAYPETVFDWSVAERLLGVGFACIYHEALYRTIKEVYGQGAPREHLAAHLEYVTHSPFVPHLLHYLSNHDDPVPHGAEDAVAKLLRLMTTLPGPMLIYNGSLLGLHARLAHHRFETLPDHLSELVQPVPDWWRVALEERNKRGV